MSQNTEVTHWVWSCRPLFAVEAMAVGIHDEVDQEELVMSRGQVCLESSCSEVSVLYQWCNHQRAR